MKSQLRSYQSGGLSLSELVEDLIFLRNALENCSDEWEVRFTDKLTDLESINSYMIEKDIEVLDELVRPIAESAISQICLLINEY